MFLAEGIRLLEEALKHHWLPVRLYFSPSMLSPRGERLANRFESRGVQAVKLSARRLRSLSDTETPQGIIGLFATPDTELVKLYRPGHRKLVLCENISDPGNLGTLIRSALAFGFDLMLLCGHSAEPYSPKVVRASAGALFGLPIAEVSTRELCSLVAKERVTVIAADQRAKHDAKPPGKTLRRQSILVAIGSEAAGLSKTILQRSAVRLRIPHRDTVESLNAAVAGSIIMKQIYDLTH